MTSGVDWSSIWIDDAEGSDVDTGREKVVRHVEAGRNEELGDARPPFPGDAVALPLLYGIAAYSLATLERVYGGGQARSATEPFDEFMVGVRKHFPIVGNLFLPHKSPECGEDEKSSEWHAKDMKFETYNIECGHRLRVAILAQGRSIRDFARLTVATSGDVDDLRRAENKLSKWLTGEARVSADYVRRIKSLYGITLDYIFDGDLSGVPSELRDRLIGLMRDHPYPPSRDE